MAADERSARVLLAELGAALPARRSAVDFARHFDGERDPGLTRALSSLRSAEARLAASLDSPLDNAPVLARLAVLEAQALEAELAYLQDCLQPEALQAGAVRLVAGLLWEARYGEGRATAYLSARHKHQPLPQFEEALDFVPENELLFLALRRFSRLLNDGPVWPKADLDWLRLRATTLPGRMRLRAAELRSAAEAAAGIALPDELVDLRRPFLQFGYEPAAALSWAVAGFSLSDALVWGAAGLPWAAQAQAWRAWGLNAKEAAAWSAADLLPDEAAAFKACGAADPATARELRHAIGDVEHFLAWHRAGFGTAEYLRLRAEGVTDLEQAKAARARAVPSKPLAPSPSPSAAPVGSPQPPSAPTPAIEGPLDLDKAQVAALAAELARPKRKASPLLEWGDEGGAWIGWAVHEASGGDLGRPRVLARSRAMGAGLMDVVNASEGVALLNAPYSCSDLEVDPAWQGFLDAYRQDLGRAPQAGRWLLMALGPRKAILYWGLHFKSTVSPWGNAIDFDFSETWEQRWKRKAEEWGEKGLACPCDVGRSPSGGWQVAAKASTVEHSGEAPLALQQWALSPVWMESVEQFCLVMGLGKIEAGWQLLAGEL